jgi:hypothetical protein
MAEPQLIRGVPTFRAEASKTPSEAVEISNPQDPRVISPTKLAIRESAQRVMASTDSGLMPRAHLQPRNPDFSPMLRRAR